jgi:hypothetical protein
MSMIAAMISKDGPFGPGLRRRGEEENNRRYFRSTKALWNLNNVAGLRIAASLAIRRGFTNSDVSPSTKRSSEVRFGARRRERLLICS